MFHGHLNKKKKLKSNYKIEFQDESEISLTTRPINKFNFKNLKKNQFLQVFYSKKTLTDGK